MYHTTSISDLFNQRIVGSPRMHLEFEEFEELMNRMQPGEWVNFYALIIFKYAGGFNPDDFNYAKKHWTGNGYICRRREIE